MKVRSIRLLLFLLLSGLGPALSAQSLTGIWRGYFISEGMEQYKFEVQIAQNGTTLTGVSYSYLDTRFYGKATLTGMFKKGSNTALVQEIKTVELRMDGNSQACIMKCRFDYVRSGNEEFLEGTFTSMYEKTEPGTRIRRGGDCGGGRVYLRRVVTSDFYVEPFLRDKPTVRKSVPQGGTVRTTPPAQKPNKPATTRTATPRTPAKTGTSTAGTKPPASTTRPRTDSVRKIEAPVAQGPRTEPAIRPNIPAIPKVTRARENELAQTLTVTNNEVLVRLYDNGEVDGDTISVYLDNKLVLQGKRLTTSPLALTLKLDEANPEHTLVMVAENLGRIPPNTSLMIVYDGDKRHQVRITSTEQKNAMVRFRYQP
ncbi:MAG TPA: hypothetical protein VHK69_14100 [Chitinophagaceae bacterium]|jgi:hypothetical protein|nr:hypothetical protein [Chitinophagaceae bacterium]